MNICFDSELLSSLNTVQKLEYRVSLTLLKINFFDPLGQGRPNYLHAGTLINLRDWSRAIWAAWAARQVT